MRLQRYGDKLRMQINGEMSPPHVKAISEYLKRGGPIKKLDPAIVTTVAEVVTYLASCGIPVRHLEGSERPYVAERKRYSASALVRRANVCRQEQRLAPFALRVGPSPRRNFAPQDL